MVCKIVKLFAKNNSQKARNFGFALLLFLVSCSQGGGSPENTNSSSTRALNGDSSTDVMCEKFNGSWEILEFKDAKREDEVFCDGEPCEHGSFRGTVVVECVDKVPSGKILLGYGSFPPPGRPQSAKVEMTVSKDSATMNYLDARRCEVSYDLKMSSSQRLSGNFTRTNCQFDADYESNKERSVGTKGVAVLTKRIKAP